MIAWCFFVSGIACSWADMIPDTGTCGNGCSYEITEDADGNKNLRIFNTPGYSGATYIAEDSFPDSGYVSGEGAYGRIEFNTITIDGDFDEIQQYAFNDTKAQEFIFNGNVKKLGEDALYGQQATSVVLPDSLTHIGDWAFDCWYDLESATLGNNVEFIGANAFGDTPIKSLVIPDSVTYVGGDAFRSVKEIIISDKLDMSGWDSDALVDDTDGGSVTFKCKGNQDVCRAKIEEFAARATYISGNNIIFDAGDHRECFRTSKDEENVSYYHTGTECAKLPESGNITCTSGYADYNGNCYAQLPFSKKRWTPAEANEWLHDGNDNFVVITFKK